MATTFSKDKKNAYQYVFGMYLCLIIGPFTCLFSVIGTLALAYAKKNDAQGTIYQSHIESILTTSWVSLVLGPTLLLLLVYGFYLTISYENNVAGASLIMGSLFAGMLLAIWYVYRVVKGLWLWSNSKPTYSIKADK